MSNEDVIRVCRKGERVRVNSKYDCEGKIAKNGGLNVRAFVMQSLKDKTQRRRAGHGGRKEKYWESAKKWRKIRNDLEILL